MAELNAAVVIPVGPGRINNLLMVMDTLQKQTVQPRLVVLVCDGEDAWLKAEGMFKIPTAVLKTPKHQPGDEQPRNIGVRLLGDIGKRDPRFAGVTHAWFLDSDVIVRPRALEYYQEAYNQAEAWRCPCGTPHAVTPDMRDGDVVDRSKLSCSKCGEWDAEWSPAHTILVGPYDWLPPGVREPMPHMRNDPDGVPPPGRWERFDRHDPDTPVVNDLFSGLACFSGNLMWPIDEFERVGGFWNDLHHGRCEDGELGVRAVSMGVPITFVRDARGWHLHHERNVDWILQTNARDVPMLDERHPDLHGCCTCGHEKKKHETEEIAEIGTDETTTLWTRCTADGCECEGYKARFFVVDEDGKRFNYRCEVCGEEMNAALSWGHRLKHRETR